MVMFFFKVSGIAPVVTITLHCIASFLFFDEMMHCILDHKEYHHNLDGVLQRLCIWSTMQGLDNVFYNLWRSSIG